ncbi:MAG: GNAT family N-acetyltransferase [Saprospiraceae bacterium]
MNNWLSPTTLRGKKVTLRPLQLSDKPALLTAAADGDLWDIWYTSVPNTERVDAYLNTALAEHVRGEGIPFVVINNDTKKVIGTTRLCNADTKNRRLEIGYTWYAKSYQRTGVNTECKHLLLQYAFEQLNCIAVIFRTNWHNHPSRRAILRLGAKQDGVLRNHRIDADGSYRDTVVFSIIESEWKGVKKALRFMMEKR